MCDEHGVSACGSYEMQASATSRQLSSLHAFQVCFEGKRLLSFHPGVQGDSDLQLERMNVYFNEASGGERTASGIAVTDCAEEAFSFVPTQDSHCQAHDELPGSRRSLRAPGCPYGPGKRAFPAQLSDVYVKMPVKAGSSLARPANERRESSLFKACFLTPAGRAGARHDGLRALRTVWPDFPAGQLHLWPGEGVRSTPLHQ